MIRLVLQFCRESSLLSTFETLQEESGVALNVVEDLDALVADVHAGQWERVLRSLADVRLPLAKLGDLYEQVALELLEIGELEAARRLVSESPQLGAMAKADPGRMRRLRALAERSFFDPGDLYGAVSRESRRARLAAALSAELSSAPPARLMALLGEALRWEVERGDVAPGVPLDVFRGVPASVAVRDEVDASPSERAATVRFEQGSHAEAAAFSPDGASLATGSSDGFVELWDPATGRARLDLRYQAEDRYMSHDAAVLALAFSRDGSLLASGDAKGAVKVWRVDSGQCVRLIAAAHAQGVTSLEFSRDGTHVLSSSFDGLARVHGIRSGRALKEFRGHEAFVSRARYSPDGDRVATASSDGTVRLWDLRTSACTAVLRPPRTSGIDPETPVVDLAWDPRDPDRLFVVLRERVAHLLSLAGGAHKTFALPEIAGSAAPGSNVAEMPKIAFVAGVPSIGGSFFYCLSSAGDLVTFAAEGDGERPAMPAIHAVDSEPVGLAHHPLRNVIATFADEPELCLWKAE